MIQFFIQFFTSLETKFKTSLPHLDFTPQDVCNTWKQNILWQNKILEWWWGVHSINQTGWPGNPLPLGYISPRNAIRHQRVRGQRIHHNSLCSGKYTKEPHRIKDGPLCLWLYTLGPIPSSPGPAWCELINHSNGLTWQTIANTVSWRALTFFGTLHTPRWKMYVNETFKSGCLPEWVLIPPEGLIERGGRAETN